MAQRTVLSAAGTASSRGPDKPQAFPRDEPDFPKKGGAIVAPPAQVQIADEEEEQEEVRPEEMVVDSEPQSVSVDTDTDSAPVSDLLKDFETDMKTALRDHEQLRARFIKDEARAVRLLRAARSSVKTARDNKVVAAHVAALDDALKRSSITSEDGVRAVPNALANYLHAVVDEVAMIWPQDTPENVRESWRKDAHAAAKRVHDGLIRQGTAMHILWWLYAPEGQEQRRKALGADVLYEDIDGVAHELMMRRHDYGRDVLQPFRNLLGLIDLARMCSRKVPLMVNDEILRAAGITDGDLRARLIKDTARQHAEESSVATALERSVARLLTSYGILDTYMIPDGLSADDLNENERYCLLVSLLADVAVRRVYNDFTSNLDTNPIAVAKQPRLHPYGSFVHGFISDLVKTKKWKKKLPTGPIARVLSAGRLGDKKEADEKTEDDDDDDDDLFMDAEEADTFHDVYEVDEEIEQIEAKARESLERILRARHTNSVADMSLGSSTEGMWRELAYPYKEGETLPESVKWRDEMYHKLTKDLPFGEVPSLKSVRTAFGRWYERVRASTMRLVNVPADPTYTQRLTRDVLETATNLRQHKLTDENIQSNEMETPLEREYGHDADPTQRLRPAISRELRLAAVARGTIIARALDAEESTSHIEKRTELILRLPSDRPSVTQDEEDEFRLLHGLTARRDPLSDADQPLFSAQYRTRRSSPTHTTPSRSVRKPGVVASVEEILNPSPATTQASPKTRTRSRSKGASAMMSTEPEVRATGRSSGYYDIDTKISPQTKALEGTNPKGDANLMLTLGCTVAAIASSVIFMLAERNVTSHTFETLLSMFQTDHIVGTIYSGLEERSSELTKLRADYSSNLKSLEAQITMDESDPASFFYNASEKVKKTKADLAAVEKILEQVDLLTTNAEKIIDTIVVVAKVSEDVRTVMGEFLNPDAITAERHEKLVSTLSTLGAYMVKKLNSMPVTASEIWFSKNRIDDDRSQSMTSPKPSNKEVGVAHSHPQLAPEERRASETAEKAQVALFSFLDRLRTRAPMGQSAALTPESDLKSYSPIEVTAALDPNNEKDVGRTSASLYNDVAQLNPDAMTLNELMTYLTGFYNLAPDTATIGALSYEMYETLQNTTQVTVLFGNTADERAAALNSMLHTAEQAVKQQKDLFQGAYDTLRSLEPEAFKHINDDLERVQRMCDTQTKICKALSPQLTQSIEKMRGSLSGGIQKAVAYAIQYGKTFDKLPEDLKKWYPDANRHKAFFSSTTEAGTAEDLFEKSELNETQATQVKNVDSNWTWATTQCLNGLKTVLSRFAPQATSQFYHAVAKVKATSMIRVPTMEDIEEIANFSPGSGKIPSVLSDFDGYFRRDNSSQPMQTITAADVPHLRLAELRDILARRFSEQGLNNPFESGQYDVERGLRDLDPDTIAEVRGSLNSDHMAVVLRTIHEYTTCQRILESLRSVYPISSASPDELSEQQSSERRREEHNALKRRIEDATIENNGALTGLNFAHALNTLLFSLSTSVSLLNRLAGIAETAITFAIGTNFIKPIHDSVEQRVLETQRGMSNVARESAVHQIFPDQYEYPSLVTSELWNRRSFVNKATIASFTYIHRFLVLLRWLTKKLLGIVRLNTVLLNKALALVKNLTDNLLFLPGSPLRNALLGERDEGLSDHSVRTWVLSAILGISAGLATTAFSAEAGKAAVLTATTALVVKVLSSFGATPRSVDTSAGLSAKSSSSDSSSIFSIKQLIGTGVASIATINRILTWADFESISSFVTGLPWIGHGVSAVTSLAQNNVVYGVGVGIVTGTAALYILQSLDSAAHQELNEDLGEGLLSSIRTGIKSLLGHGIVLSVPIAVTHLLLGGTITQIILQNHAFGLAFSVMRSHLALVVQKCIMQRVLKLDSRDRAGPPTLRQTLIYSSANLVMAVAMHFIMSTTEQHITSYLFSSDEPGLRETPVNPAQLYDGVETIVTSAQRYLTGYTAPLTAMQTALNTSTVDALTGFTSNTSAVRGTIFIEGNIVHTATVEILRAMGNV